MSQLHESWFTALEVLELTIDEACHIICRATFDAGSLLELRRRRTKGRSPSLTSSPQASRHNRSMGAHIRPSKQRCFPQVHISANKAITWQLAGLLASCIQWEKTKPSSNYFDITYFINSLFSSYAISNFRRPSREENLIIT